MKYLVWFNAYTLISEPELNQPERQMERLFEILNRKLFSKFSSTSRSLLDDSAIKALHTYDRFMEDGIS